MTANDSIDNAFDELLKSTAYGSSPNALMGYLEPQQNLEEVPPEHQSLNDSSISILDVSGFCSKKQEWLTSSQIDEHDSCKCIKEEIIINETKNIRLTTTTAITGKCNFHFCNLDENVKYCNSTAKIDTYIANSCKRRQSRGVKVTKNKPTLQVKVNLGLWKPAALEIRLKDIYTSKNLLSYVLPELRYQKGTIVWVKMAGYPSWPAMIDDDPDYQTYYWIMQTTPQKVQYHVVFFDEPHLVSRYWAPEKEVKHFHFKPFINFNSMIIFKRFQAGLLEAKKAITMSIEERLNTYSFVAKAKQPNVCLVEK